MEEATKPTKLMYGICVLDCVFAVKWSAELPARLPAVCPGQTQQMVSEAVGKGMFTYLRVYICQVH